MIGKLPEQVIKYMINKLPPYTGIFIIRVDNEGKIIDWHGSSKEYMKQKPVKGMDISENIPALMGMIPPLIDPMVLQNIHTYNEKYADIHIIDDYEGSYWVFFVDRSKEAESIRNLQQKFNETLINLQHKKGESSTDSRFGQLHILDIVMLEQKKDNLFYLLGETPLWFNDVAPNLIGRKNEFDITEQFPFIEVFLIEAEEFWGSEKNNKLKSGIWIEQSISGKEYKLIAYAVNYKKKNYLLIKELSDEFDKELEVMQTAREQNLAFDKLAKAEKKLKELLIYKDKFVSIVSHDLRSPVASVLGIAEMLINDKEFLENLDDFNKEMIINIKEEMIRLLDYNDKLYHWSNLELGNFELVKTKAKLIDLVKSAARVAKQKLLSKNINFTYNIPENLAIEVDTSLFVQVLNNLVGNALKFTPENGNISINAKMEKDQITISVNDSGVGMPIEVQKNLFKGFSRGSTLGTKGEKGTGLGIGIVQKIIESHGFKIRVESELGKGSSFIITI